MMKLALTLEADSVNVQALNMGRIVVDIDGVNITELINKVAENGDSLRVVDERVIEQHIEAGISLCDAVNFLVEKYALVRTDQPGFSAGASSQLINSIDILRARRATGLMTRHNYRTVNNITLGKYPEAK